MVYINVMFSRTDSGMIRVITVRMLSEVMVVMIRNFMVADDRCCMFFGSIKFLRFKVFMFCWMISLLISV